MDELEKKLNEISERINRAPLNEEKQNSYTETLFESIKHINEYGNEFWYARELQKALEYNQWRRFEEVIERAKNACKNSGNIISEHFANQNPFEKNDQAEMDFEPKSIQSVSEKTMDVFTESHFNLGIFLAYLVLVLFSSFSYLFFKDRLITGKFSNKKNYASVYNKGFQLK